MLKSPPLFITVFYSLADSRLMTRFSVSNGLLDISDSENLLSSNARIEETAGGGYSISPTAGASPFSSVGLNLASTSDSDVRFISFGHLLGSHTNDASIQYIPNNLYFVTDRPWLITSSATVQENFTSTGTVNLGSSAETP